MLKNMLVIIGIMTGFVYAGDEATEKPPVPYSSQKFTFNITLENSNAISASSQNQSTQTTDVNVENENNANAEVGDITLTQKVTDSGVALAALLAGQLKKEKASLQEFVSYCFENKFKVTCYGLVFAYGYILYQLKKMERVLCNEHLWSLWKKQQSLQELYMTNDNELVNDLLFAIQGRYTNVHNLDDFNTPLTFFVKDIDQEGQMLTAYVKLAACLRKCKVGKFFPINKKLIEQAAKRKDRLDYLKSRIWSWISAHKVNQVYMN